VIAGLDRYVDGADSAGGWNHFGREVTEHGTFDGGTIPSASRIGWFFGTGRWRDGEFFASGPPACT
jgi:hypothetical protein